MSFGFAISRLWSVPRLTGWLLVALLCVTAQGMAVARGAPGASGTLEICGSTGPAMVDLDASGKPLGPPHLCPDWAMSLLNAGLPPVPAAVLPATLRPLTLQPVRAALASDAALPPRASARAPPPRA